MGENYIEDILGQLAGDLSESADSQVWGGFFGPTSANLIYLPVIERQ